MKAVHYLSDWFAGMARVFARQFRLIFKDEGVLIFFVVLPLMYPLVYTLIYNKEIVRELPVAVVDNCRSAESRELVRTISASPTITIYDYVDDLYGARRLMAERKVFGVLEIPSGYGSDVVNGTGAHVTFYSDMSLLIRFRSFMSAFADIQIKLASDISSTRINDLGAGSYLTGESALPIASESNFLGDVEQGFASFIIPGIVILILQQSMLLGIGMLDGTARERRRRNHGRDPLGYDDVCASATVWGRALCFFVLYVALTIYDLRIVPIMFRLPAFGDPSQYLALMVPFLLAAAFLGQTLAPLMRERESPFVVIVASSAVFLFLSGLPWPRFAMSTFWQTIGNLIPSTWGVDGFVRINSNCASLAQSGTEFLWLWALTALYMVTAIMATRYVRRRDSRKTSLLQH